MLLMRWWCCPKVEWGESSGPHLKCWLCAHSPHQLCLGSCKNFPWLSPLARLYIKASIIGVCKMGSMGCVLCVPSAHLLWGAAKQATGVRGGWEGCIMRDGWKWSVAKKIAADMRSLQGQELFLHTSCTVATVMSQKEHREAAVALSLGEPWVSHQTLNVNESKAPCCAHVNYKGEVQELGRVGEVEQDICVLRRILWFQQKPLKYVRVL